MRLTIRWLNIGRGINKRFLQPFGGMYLMDCEEMQSRGNRFKWNLFIPFEYNNVILPLNCHTCVNVVQCEIKRC